MVFFSNCFYFGVRAIVFSFPLIPSAVPDGAILCCRLGFDRMLKVSFLNTVKIACGDSCRSNTGVAVGSRGAASIVERDNELTET